MPVVEHSSENPENDVVKFCEAGDYDIDVEEQAPLGNFVACGTLQTEFQKYKIKHNFYIK